MTKLEKDIAGPEVKTTLQESFKLAEALGMNGTPSYVIGDSVVVGAVGLEALQAKINASRCGKASC
jgi:protein-disulfide isomerase